MAEEQDFFIYYKAASSKLKKRFLKKPNIAEASNEFEQLKNHLSRIECYPYAGFVATAKAKCEQGLLNPAGEVDSLIEAARFFLKADQEIDDMGCPNFHEHLECAICCYNFAIRVYEDSKMASMAGTVCLEMAEYYYKSRRYEQALQHYQRAMNYFEDIPSQSATVMNKVLTCQIIMSDFNTALVTSMKIINLIKKMGSFHPDGVTPLGSFHEMYMEVEVTRLLVLLILHPHPRVVHKDYAEVLQQYTWPDEDSLASGSCFLERLLGEDLFIYLQSLVMACASEDVSAMETVQDEIRIFINKEQNVLVQRIIDEFKHPKGLGF